jgi:secreted trypsin-like serine protease
VERYDFVNTNETYQSFNVLHNIVHPEFDDQTFRHDFAVVILDGSVQGVPPIRLNSDPATPYPTESLSVFGWGAIANQPEAVYPNVFQKGVVQALSNYNCANVYIQGQTLYKGDIYDEMLCAVSSTTDSCSGDSGGALIVDGPAEGLDLLVGSVSWGRGCLVYPGAYPCRAHRLPSVPRHPFSSS